MEIEEYFNDLTKYFNKAYSVASAARAKGYDPETYVEIKPAPDLASRVEGIIALDGIAEIIRKKTAKSRQELAFAMVEEVCKNEKFSSDVETRMTLAVRVGLSVLTEGILVAPTEGFQKATLHKNPDGSDYIAVLYAGPIRGAGGTSAALSVALADYGRKLLNIGEYRAQKDEVERCLEETMTYHLRAARLQYLPKEEDIRVILENCPVCIDGLPTEQIEVSSHRNIKRLDANGKEEIITNRIRGGVPLVVCEGIAQKAKSVLKHTKNAGLDWSWLNNIIKADKIDKTSPKPDGASTAVFLDELVAGRPVLSYPGFPGAFRLRYGRSRFTGMASKGFSPATMLLLDEYIAIGTQLKVEKPGKGCIAVPVDSIEGPFVKLDDGRAFRINTAEEARTYKDRIRKIIAVGDILITFGDFKKTNTLLQPTSYVEEYWYEQLKANGYDGSMPEVKSFNEALGYSEKFKVPMHPRYTYDYNDISQIELKNILNAMTNARINSTNISETDSLEFTNDNGAKTAIVDAIERLCIPHIEKEDSLLISGSDAQSLLFSLGLVKDNTIDFTQLSRYSGIGNEEKVLEILNKVAPFMIMQRSTRIGGRIGRPEKAKERLMAPPPNGLFPIAEYGGKERSLTKAYNADKKRFGGPNIEIDMARYRCSVANENIPGIFCERHMVRGYIEKVCQRCGRVTTKDVCPICTGNVSSYETKKIDLVAMTEAAQAKIKLGTLPKLVKGVKGMLNKSKEVEPIEKGLLRSIYGVYIFKDGTARFDATDVPITHFYPKEVGISVEKARELGYNKDYLGKELESADQLVEMRHQDVILNNRGAEYILKVSKFVDSLLERYYGMDKFYNAESAQDLVGHCVVTLSPHTSAGVLCRVIGFTDANVGFAHPYVIAARRRNCDGDEDTTMLLMDSLINFSKKYLPTTIGGTMDAPLILTTKVMPEEVDDEVHEMEVVQSYGKDFYDKTFQYASPGEVKVERVGSRLNSKTIFSELYFTHLSSVNAIGDAPKRSMYTKMKTMAEKIEQQFSLMDKLCTIDKADTARRLIMSHFIPDLMGNLHSFSRQTFRCISCNAKYRRVPLIGVCTKCKGKIVLTISKGGIEKYLNTATALAERYHLEPYISQRIKLLKDEIETVFGGVGAERSEKQFNLSSFM